MAYNATALKFRGDGSLFSREAVEVDSDGTVVRACGLWSHSNGTPQFEETWRAAQFSMVASITIVAGTDAYIDGLRRDVSADRVLREV